MARCCSKGRHRSSCVITSETDFAVRFLPPSDSQRSCCRMASGVNWSRAIGPIMPSPLRDGVRKTASRRS